MTSAPTRQALPNTMEQAQREIEYWRAALQLAQVKFMVAKRQMEQAQTELDAVKLIAAGDFVDVEPAPNGYVQSVHREHAVGSRGPWGWQA